MLRHLLATTALVAVISTAAFAGETAAMKDGGQAGATDDTGVFEFELHTLSPDATTGILATNMVGKPIMTSKTSEGEEIGDINDVVFSRDGSVRAVIVGVGGFLGIGEKEVALDFSRLNFVAGNDNRLIVVSDVSRQELEDATAYERPEYIPHWMTAEGAREQMDKAAEKAKTTYQVVREEAIDPARQKLDEAMTESWTAEKTEVDAASVSTDDLIDSTVYTSEDTDIGEVAEVLIGKDGKAQAVVIDVGGFLGFNAKPVAVSYNSLKMFETENGDLLVTAPFTKEQLENAQTYEPATYKSNPDAVLLKG